jgi:hypothetical protein
MFTLAKCHQKSFLHGFSVSGKKRPFLCRTAESFAKFIAADEIVEFVSTRGKDDCHRFLAEQNAFYNNPKNELTKEVFRALADACDAVNPALA